MASELFPAFPSAPSPKIANTRKSQEQFLRFYLGPDTQAMLPVGQLAEVLTVPAAQIIPIPHLPSWVMGVYNWRGEILWMVDLGHLLGLASGHQSALRTATYRAIAIHSAPARSQTLGLVVSQVEDIDWCNPDEIQSPPISAVTPSLVPFLRGYWLKESGDMILTLDGEAILAAMPKP